MHLLTIPNIHGGYVNHIIVNKGTAQVESFGEGSSWLSCFMIDKPEVRIAGLIVPVALPYIFKAINLIPEYDGCRFYQVTINGAGFYDKRPAVRVCWGLFDGAG